MRGHCDVFAAHLSKQGAGKGQSWASVLVGALLSGKGRSIPTLVGALAPHLRVPPTVRHVWLTDSGMLSRPLLRALWPQHHFALGRLRRNQQVYFAPRRCSPRQRRPRVFGQSCRVDQLRTRFPQRLRPHQTVLRVRSPPRAVHVYEAPILLRGVWPHRALSARVVLVTVPSLALAPWYLRCTDLTFDAVEAVHTYAGRCQIDISCQEGTRQPSISWTK